MATIPLPALHTAPIEQPPSPLAMYAQLMGIKNQQQELQQRQAMAPLQQEQAQQAVQAGQLENQQRQQQQQDVQTLRSLSPNFLTKDENGKVTGYDFNGLFNQAASSGVSPQTLAAFQKSISDATLARANATKAERENQQAVNAEAFNHLEGLRGAQDPAQRQQLWQSAVQWSMKNSAALGIDPGKFPTQAPDDNGLSALEASLGMHAQQIADAGKLAETDKNVQQGKEASAKTAQTEAETKFYEQNGGAPGVPAEAVQQADWLKKNPGKGPSDYVLWKDKNAPSVIVQNMSTAASAGSAPGSGGAIDWGKAAQRYGMTPAAFDQTAEKYFQTGQLPPIGRSSNAIAMNRDLMNRAAELHPNVSLAENSAEYKANADSLKKLLGATDQLEAFEGTANKNIELLKSIAAKVPDLGVRFANVPVRMLTGNTIGTENMAAFKTALAPVQTEAAKILNSANLQGVLSDSARHELQEIVDGNATYPALVASLNVLQKDFSNRRESNHAQIQDIQTRLGGTRQPQEGTTKTNSHGDKIVFRGGQWQMAQ
jgi:hypothetical protein